MKVKVFATSEEMGKAASAHAKEIINSVIEKGETARILLSTGASQFPFF